MLVTSIFFILELFYTACFFQGHQKSVSCRKGLTLTPWILILTHQQQTAFENIVGKGEIALLFPQGFLLNQIIVSLFVHIFDIISLFAAELEEPKIGMSDKRLKSFFYWLMSFTFFVCKCLQFGQSQIFVAWEWVKRNCE